MGDIAVGAVTPGNNADIRRGDAGGTIAAGDPLRLVAATGKYVAAKADSSTTSTVVGLALHAAVANQPIAFIVSGLLPIASVATVGTVYVLSAAAAGGVAPWADLTSNQIVTVLAVATVATVLDVKIHNSGAAIP